MSTRVVLWRRVDSPGHESARIYESGTGCRLDGTAVFTHDEQPCRLDYRISCDSKWRTLSADVDGWVGERIVTVAIKVSGESWQLNGHENPQLQDCIDVDLNFSPSTNLLPIRRLSLAVGESASVRAAWLRFPGFNLEPLEQTYSRLTENMYRYESAGGKFVRDLQVNDDGFVVDYPGLWMLS